MKLTEYKGKHAHYFKDERGLRQGEYNIYHSNGQLQIHCFYKDDKVNGEYKKYKRDGSLDYKCFYKDNIIHGEYNIYLSNGKLVTKYFSNGKNVTDMYKKLNVWKSL